MSIFLNYIRNEIHINDYRKLLYLINSLIDENKKLLGTLPEYVQNGLGKDIYSIRHFNANQFEGLMSNPVFGRVQYEKEIAKLVFVFKELLSTHVSLLGHHNMIDKREHDKLQAQLKEPKLIDSTNVLTKDVYVKHYDSATYAAKYNSFVTPTGTGTIGELHNELENALKNLSVNSKYFGFTTPVGYNSISINELGTAKKYISSGVSKYDADKKNLLDYIEQLLKVVSECIIIDENKYKGVSLTYSSVLTSSITNMIDSNNIYGKTLIMDFIKNLAGKPYPVYAGYWGHNDRINVIKTRFDTSVISDYEKEIIDLNTDITKTGALKLKDLKKKVEDMINFFDANAPYLYLSPAENPIKAIKNNHIQNVKSNLFKFKPLYDQIIIGTKTLYEHVDKLITYFQQLLKCIFICLVIDLAKDGFATAKGPKTGFNKEDILLKYKTTSYSYKDIGDFFDADEIQNIITSFTFTSTVDTIKSYVDEVKNYPLPFSLFKPLYDNYTTPTADYTDLSSTKTFKELYTEIDNALTHLDTHKGRLGLVFANKANIDITNMKITKPSNANLITIKDSTGKNIKLDAGIDDLEKYIKGMLSVSSKIFINNDVTLSTLDDSTLNAINSYADLSSNLITKPILTFLDLLNINATINTTLINTVKNKIEAVETILPVSRFKSKYLDLKTINDTLDQHLTTGTSKTGTDLYNVMDELMQDVYDNYEILDKTKKSNKGTTINSKADITYQHIIDIVSDVTANQASDSGINIYISGNVGAVVLEKLDKAKRRLHELIVNLMKGIYAIRVWDSTNGDVLKSIDIDNKSGGLFTEGEWLANIKGKPILTELTNLNGDGRDLITSKTGPFVTPRIVLTGGSNKSIYLNKYLKYKNKYLELKQLMGKI
jgi:hypothetical protein